MMDIIVKIWDFIADKWPVVGSFIAVIVVTAFVVCSKVNFPHFRFEKGTT